MFFFSLSKSIKWNFSNWNCQETCGQSFGLNKLLLIKIFLLLAIFAFFLRNHPFFLPHLASTFRFPGCHARHGTPYHGAGEGTEGEHEHSCTQGGSLGTGRGWTCSGAETGLHDVSHANPGPKLATALVIHTEILHLSPESPISSSRIKRRCEELNCTFMWLQIELHSHWCQREKYLGYRTLTPNYDLFSVFIPNFLSIFMYWPVYQSLDLCWPDCIYNRNVCVSRGVSAVGKRKRAMRRASSLCELAFEWEWPCITYDCHK